MPFRERFDCLWCGRPWTTRGSEDLEGWAQLCPDCLGKAGTNEFLRLRLRAGIEERTATKPPVATATRATPPERARTMIDYYEARAAEYTTGTSGAAVTRTAPS